MSISSNQGPVEWRAASLYTPPLEKIAKDLDNGLREYFGDVEVKVIKCPDLNAAADNASQGICGNTKLVEVGGPPYIKNELGEENQRKIYYIPDVLKLTNNKEALVFGAAAASSKLFPDNAELIPNVNLTQCGKTIKNNSRYSEVDPLQNAVVGKYDSIRTGGLANFFICDGKMNENILLIKCKKRLTPTNFTNAIRAVLTDKTLAPLNDDTKQIGLGGVIKINRGKIRAHIMNGYAKCCQPSTEWLSYYDVGPDLSMFSTMITDDPTPDKSLNLRVEHTHFYATDGSQQAGHYHDDVTPDTIEYEGYFNLAQSIYRIDNATRALQRSKL